MAGLVVAGGLFGLVYGLQYKLGSLTRMGPGFFPVALSVLVIALAGASAVRALVSHRDENGEGLSFARALPVVWVGLGLVAWTLLLRDFGMLAANAALVVLAAFARPPVRIVPVVGLIAGLSLAGWAIFIWGLSMPLTMLGR